MPNHKNAPVGPNCPMNAAGRHFRNQDDPTIPVCDYDGCSFFGKDDLATVEYPTDISTGPVVVDTPATTQSSEIAEVMALLRQQKSDEDLRNQNVLALQKQVNELLQSGLLAAAAPPPVIATCSPIYSQNTPTYSSPLTAPTPAASSAAPQMPSLSSGMPSNIASAATDYLARLGLSSPSQGTASGFAGNNNTGMAGQQYQPGNQQQFQPVTVSNPLAGMGAALGV